MDSPSRNALQISYDEFLSRLWNTHLKVANIGVGNVFFDTDGSSLQVIEMLTTVTEKFGKETDYAEFFKDLCIRKLSEPFGVQRAS